LTFLSTLTKCHDTLDADMIETPRADVLEHEVIWGHIDILVVAVRRLSRWKVKTLLAGPSPTSPMKAEITISPISNTPPWESEPPWTKIRTFKLPFLKLPSSPFLKLSSSPGSYTEQYHMEQIRLLHSPTKVPRLPSSRGLSTGVLTFIYRLPSPEAFPRFPGGYTFIYRLSPPETIHGLHRSSSSAKSI